MSATLADIIPDLLIGDDKTAQSVDLDTLEIITDSRKAAADTLFFAIPGTKVDGTQFIPDAVAKGCRAIVAEAPHETQQSADFKYIQVSDVREACSRCHRHINNLPDEKLDIFGVTGTNGKTTTVYLLRHFLNILSCKCAMISTVEFDDTSCVAPPTHTTPDPDTLFALLDRAVKNKAKCAAMEFSSHALEQKRLAGIQLKAAILTNVTGDHLDFHKTMENYFAAKRKLFTGYLRSGGVAVLNADDTYARALAAELHKVRPDIKVATFGTSPEADYRICEAQSTGEFCSFLLHTPDGKKLPINFPLPGAYNIHNLAGVLTALLSCGADPELLLAGCQTSLRIPGRLELLKREDGAKFYIDFAHTHDALQNVLTTLRHCCKGRLIVLFGCGGDRDKTKRPLMGKAASQYADITIVTSDNPRSENPETIISEIVSGIEHAAIFFTVADRREAIKKANAIAQVDDIVLIAGKGHENYQEINGVKYDFDDMDELKKCFEYKSTL